MGALQARLVFLAFVGLSAVIAYNAIYLQDGPRPADLSAHVDKLNSHLRTATTATSGTRKPRSTASVKTETVRSVQRKLAEKGYDPGPADGVHGLLTRAAIMAFQYDHDLPMTGEVSDTLLEQIVFGGAIGQGSDQGSENAVPEETVALIKAVQQILAKMGYDPGPVDGIMGSGTRRAIQRFEEEQKLPVKGRISGQLLKALVKVTGAKLASIQTG